MILEHAPGIVTLRADVAQDVIRAPILAHWLEDPAERYRLTVAIRLFRRRVYATLAGSAISSPPTSSARHRSAISRHGYRR